MAYKAFNPDFTCKGKQYEENTTYEENGNEICEAGVRIDFPLTVGIQTDL
jgi:hypothetical protein